MLSKGVIKARTPNPLVISVIRRDILLIFVGVERPISRTHPKVKGIVTSAICKDI